MNTGVKTALPRPTPLRRLLTSQAQKAPLYRHKKHKNTKLEHITDYRRKSPLPNAPDWINTKNNLTISEQKNQSSKTGIAIDKSISKAINLEPKFYRPSWS
jgi:hypothetical protein